MLSQYFQNRTPIRTRITAFWCFRTINIEKVYQNDVNRFKINFIRNQL
jgi:hypothetical protein